MIKKHVKRIAKRHLREIVVYGVVGVNALILQDILYWFLHRDFGVYPSVAMLAGNLAGTLLAYFGHIKFTFRKQRYSRGEFIKFVVTSMIGLCINVGGVRILTKVFILSPEWGLLPTLFAPVVTFLVSKFWAFR